MPLGLNWPLSLHFIDLLWAGLLFVAHLATVARALTRANRTPASRVAWVATIMLLPIVGVLAYLLLGETSIGRGRFERLRRASSALRLPPQAPVLAPDRDAPLMDLARVRSTALAPWAATASRCWATRMRRRTSRCATPRRRSTC